MRTSPLAITFGCLTLLATSALMTPQEYMDVFGGDFNIYARILSLTDCAALEGEFNRAESESKGNGRGSPKMKSLVGYMLAIAERLEEIDCGDVARLEQANLSENGSRLVHKCAS